MKHESNTEFFINVGKLAEIIAIWQAPEADIEGTIKLLRKHSNWMIFGNNQQGETTYYHLRDEANKEVATLTDFEEVWNHEASQKAFKELVFELSNKLYKAHESPIEWDDRGELADIARERDFTLDRLLVDYVVYWAKEDVYKLNCVLEAICQKLGTTLKAGDE
jgi:hypothetical protein